MKIEQNFINIRIENTPEKNPMSWLNDLFYNGKYY